MPNVQQMMKRPTVATATPAAQPPAATAPQNTPANAPPSTVPGELPGIDSQAGLALMVSSGAALAEIAKVTAGLPQVAVDQIDIFQGGAYVAYNSNRGKAYTTLCAKGVPDGCAYLSTGDTIHPCPVLKHWVLASFKCFSRMSSDGDILSTSLQKTDHSPDEHYVCLVLVDIADTLWPVKGDFRTTKSGAVNLTITQIEEATKPDWLQKSPEHLLTGQFPRPWGRVTTYVDSIPAKSKSTGNSYHRAVPVCNPTSINDMVRILQSFRNPDFVARYNESLNVFNARVKELQSKLK